MKRGVAGNERGIALILVFMVITVLTVLGMGIVTRSISENKIVERQVMSTQAFWLAEVGLQSSLSAIRNNNWLGWLAQGTTRTIVPNLGAGFYTATVTNVGSANPQINSIGNVRGIQRTIIANVAQIAQDNLAFTGGVFARSEFIMSGNGRVDSYDSRIGPYGGNNIGTEGDVGSNGVVAGTIRLSGNANINGDASTGPNGTITTSGNAQVNGQQSHNNNVVVPSVVVPAGLRQMGSSGNYNLNGNNSASLGNGAYRYDSLNISGNGRLTITGTVQIYLSGNSSLNISGNAQLVIANGGSLEVYTNGTSSISGNGVVNQTTLPRNFALYSTYAGPGNGVSISGNGNLYGGIYAPDTGVTNSGNGDVFGYLVGSQVSITGNGSVHNDLGFQGRGGVTITFSISNWSDQNNPYSLL